MGLSRFIDNGLRSREQERLVRESGLFDAEWYVARYPEVGKPSKALSHFLRTGAVKGFDPGPSFNAGAYLADNPDVRQAGVNPLVHFLRFGRFEGRKARDGEGRLSGVVDANVGEEGLKRLAEGFDSSFYQATNPDLPKNTDFFVHFMEVGWRERRDPAPWFSVEHYLLCHEDVAEADQNPFTHYVLWGCREGRVIANSRRPELRLPKAPAKGSLSTLAVAMVKNEADIIRCWAAHLLALFDEIIVVDHGSEDGTAEFLQALATGNHRVRFWRLEEPSYVQSVTMTHVMRNCPEVAAADWVFFLDADEFLPFADREAFHAALEPYQSCPVIHLNWRNLVPEQYWDGETEIDAETRLLMPKSPSPFRKIAFQPSRLNLQKAVVAQGNHRLLEVLNGGEIPSFAASFPLLHVPVRSADQLILKLNQGVLAYQKIGRTRDKGQGTHWYQMKEATAACDLTDDLLNGVVANYSEDKPELRPVSHDRLERSGHEWRTFDLATCDLTVVDMPRRGLGEMLMRVHGRDFSDAANEDRVSVTRLQETEDGRLISAPGDVGAEYAALPAVRENTGAPGLTAVLKDLFQPSYHCIEHLMPDDWAGHIPFMFSLTRLLQPRRFVELGTLRGTSFFAFAQSAEAAGMEGDAVAISSWTVEAEQAAEYRGVFENFEFIAKRYADRASYLQLGFEEAERRFEDGSIDLLHLDGFREYDGAAHVLERWLPKLSDRGVLMLHDVAAHGAGFGVWRLWEELRERFPTLEFQHAEGLGVACVGAQVPASLRVICDAVRQDAHMAVLLQEHFEQLGQLMPELFSRRFDMAQAERRAGAEGALAEELTWLRQQLSTAETELRDLKTHLNGKLRHAAG